MHSAIKKKVSGDTKPADKTPPSVAVISPSVPASTLEADQVAEVMELLAQKRADHAAADTDVHADFDTCVRGGAWTAQNRGVPVDSVRGQAARQDIRDWCKSCGLQMSFTCSYRSLGEVSSTKLAQEWCRRMQWIFDFWQSREKLKLDEFVTAVTRDVPEDEQFEKFMSENSNEATEERLQAIRLIAPSRMP